MLSLARLVAALLVGAAAVAPLHAQPLQADVVHWWTSGGETAAMRALADAYRAAGGRWRDLAVPTSDQARVVVLDRIASGHAPTAAQFNPSRRIVELARQGKLNTVDDVAAQGRWAQLVPEVMLDAVRVDGHLYAAPISVHMPGWLWSSKPALAKAGVKHEPRSMDELFAALDKLQAAGLIPLAHGGQPWQDLNLFATVLANQGGRDLYLAVLRDRDPAALRGEPLRQALLTFKKLRRYVDPASPGRSWSDSTALLVGGRAGLQFMGDWVKGEFAQAGQQPGRDYGCTLALHPRAPAIVDGDVLVFPKDKDGSSRAAQQLLARVATSADTQLAFSARKGSLPVRADVDTKSLDTCGQLGAAALRDNSRLVGNTDLLLAPEPLNALEKVITDYWNHDTPVERVQQQLAQALQKT